MTARLSKRELALAHKTQERKILVQRIIRFVSNLTDKHGTLTYENVGSCYIRQKKEMELGKFKFYTDFGQTMFGGNKIKITFEGQGVFCVYWQEEDKEEISIFDNSRQWRIALESIMKDSRSILARMRKEKRAAEKNRQQAMQVQAQRKLIHKAAARLRV